MRAFFILATLAACTPVSRSVIPVSASGEPATTSSARGDSSELLVTTQPTCPTGIAGCDILEIVDLHTDAASQDKGFDELRRRARARGGDAVLGAEFEHGDAGEQSHLSGVIVRYGEAIPPHSVLGEIEVASEPTDQRKGLEELVARASAMGGDQVIAVTFEHGEAGAMGRLHGQVIRYRH